MPAFAGHTTVRETLTSHSSHQTNPPFIARRQCTKRSTRFPCQLFQKTTSLGVALLEALELPPHPAQQRQIDVPEHRLQRRWRVSPVVLDPAPQKGVEPLGDFRQRQLRLSTEFQVPDRGPYILQRHGADRWVEPPEQLLIPGILDQAGPEAVSEEVERDVRIGRRAFYVLTVDDPGFDGMQFQKAFRQASLKISLEGFGFLLSSQ
jgi:hypothetical protein